MVESATHSNDTFTTPPPHPQTRPSLALRNTDSPPLIPGFPLASPSPLSSKDHPPSEHTSPPPPGPMTPPGGRATRLDPGPPRDLPMASAVPLKPVPPSIPENALPPTCFLHPCPSANRHLDLPPCTPGLFSTSGPAVFLSPPAAPLRSRRSLSVYLARDTGDEERRAMDGHNGATESEDRLEKASGWGGGL